MTFLKLLLSSSIIYITVIAIANPMHDEESKIKEIEIHEEPKIVRSVLNNKSIYISDNILPLYYNINLTFLNNYLVSECIITIYISDAQQYISFYVPDSTNIIAWKLTQDKRVFETISIYRDNTNIVLLDFGDVLLRGKYDLYIQFKIPINIVRESFGIPYINKDEKIE